MWSSKSFGSCLKYGFFQLLIRLRLGSLARMAIFPISLYYSVKPSVRKKAACYLQRRFPEANKREIFIHTIRLYHNFANILFDRMVAGAGHELPILHDYDTLSLMREILDKGKGCIVVGAHFGCWQTGLSGLTALGKPIGVVFWQEEKIEHLYFHYENEVRIINANGGLSSILEMRNLLGQNGILCIMGDRMTPGDKYSARVRFLGGTIEIPTFPYLLSKKTGAPVIHAASIRQNGKIAGLPSVINPCADNAAAVFARYLENLVARYPHDFFNFHDMWGENNAKR